MSDMRPQFVVSIINYKTGSMTLDCVRSVLADMGDIRGHVVIVDNASGDGSEVEIAAWIAAQPAGTPVSLICSDANTGFSGGHNQTMAGHAADFYLLLNSDALVRKGCLRALLSAAVQEPKKTGLFGCRLVDEEGAPQTACFRFPGIGSEFIRGAHTGVVTRLLNSAVVPLGQDPDSSQIDWVSFASVLLRHEMVQELGPMDEGYFLYFEDTEYSLRARRAGWGVRYVAQAEVVHFHGASGDAMERNRLKARMPAYYYASRTRFFYQAHGWPGLLAANLAWHAGRAIAVLRKVVGRPVPPSHAYEARDIWMNFTKPLGPRYGPET